MNVCLGFSKIYEMLSLVIKSLVIKSVRGLPTFLTINKDNGLYDKRGLTTKVPNRW